MIRPRTIVFIVLLLVVLYITFVFDNFSGKEIELPMPPKVPRTLQRGRGLKNVASEDDDDEPKTPVKKASKKTDDDDDDAPPPPKKRKSDKPLKKKNSEDDDDVKVAKPAITEDTPTPAPKKRKSKSEKFGNDDVPAPKPVEKDSDGDEKPPPSPRKKYDESSGSGNSKLPALQPFKGDTSVCCAQLRAAQSALLLLPSDIQNLLPIWHAYIREPDLKTVVEAGSRLGSSTMTMLHAMRFDMKKRFATVDLEIRQPVQSMYKCEKECTKAEYPDREFFTVQGNDLLVKIPFVTDPESDDRPIDIMFIDTLHNGDLLMMELKRFPRYVRKYLVFHDTHSFTFHDEASHVKAVGFPSGKKRPVGLHASIKDFLLNNPEWEEEMNNVHNNGFYVLRRRDVPPGDLAVLYPGMKVDDKEIAEAAYGANNNIARGAKTACIGAYRTMYSHLSVSMRPGDDPCVETGMWVKNTPLSGPYNTLIVREDLPIAAYLPLILSHVIAMSKAQGNRAVGFHGCDMSAFIAFVHGAYWASIGSSYYLRSGCDMKAQFKKHSQPKEEMWAEGTQDLIVVSAEFLSQSSDEEIEALQKATKSRIVCYGTSTADVKKAHQHFIENGFALKTALKASVGMAMWERHVNAKALLYVPEAQRDLPEAPEGEGKKKTKKKVKKEEKEAQSPEGDDEVTKKPKKKKQPKKDADESHEGDAPITKKKDSEPEGDSPSEENPNSKSKGVKAPKKADDDAAGGNGNNHEKHKEKEEEERKKAAEAKEAEERKAKEEEKKKTKEAELKAKEEQKRLQEEEKKKAQEAEDQEKQVAEEEAAALKKKLKALQRKLSKEKVEEGGAASDSDEKPAKVSKTRRESAQDTQLGEGETKAPKKTKKAAAKSGGGGGGNDLELYRGDEGEKCCGLMREIQKVLFVLPSDIQNLLPIWHAYIREFDMKTIIEAGSRLGSSTMTMLHAMRYDMKKRFATVDLEIRQPVQAMYKCEKECTKSEYPDREFMTVEGNDLAVKIPFVEDPQSDDRPIDLLFIDTLHNGDLLTMELKRFPRYVRKYIVFHDTQSFKKGDEDQRWKALGFPEGVKRPVGLFAPIRDFLLQNANDWVEEMSFVHNNGFLVLRRKSVPPGDLKVRRPDMDYEGGLQDIIRNDAFITSRAQSICSEKYNDMYRIQGISMERHSNPCISTNQFTRQTPLTTVYNNLITREDLPTAAILPLIMGHVVATQQSTKKVFFFGCDASVFIAFAHGTAFVGGHGSYMLPEGQSCDSEREMKSRMDKVSSFPPASGVSLVVASAKFISQASESELESIAEAAQDRIVVYGTSVHDVKGAHKAFTADKKFILKQALSQTVGIAMWARAEKSHLLYIQEAGTTE